jgi:RNA polymerase sigma-70 factor, ECF subfamily
MGDRVGALTSRAGQPLCDDLHGLPDPEAHLAALLARAELARFAVDPDVFLAYVVDRLPEDARLADLDALHLDDLYLACACANGDSTALAALERSYGADLRSAIATVDRSGAHRDDIMQMVRARLFVASDDQPPRIADYTGRGKLFSWLRVVVVREALALVRKPKREIAMDDVPEDAVDDLELGVFKGLYQTQFKTAFATAVGELSARERNLLRLHLIDKLSIDEIGAAHRTHRTTAARWLREIRAKLAARTRDLLATALALPDRELDSVMRLVRSRLELSVSRLLEAG